MIKFLADKVSSIVSADLRLLILFLGQRNRLLAEKNRTLNKTIKEHIRTIATLKKVLAVVKNTEATDLAGNVKRMQDGKL